MITRRATISDAEILFQWRNDPLTRQMSRNMDPIAREDHVAWLASSLENPDRILMIGEVDGDPIGTIRFDRHADHNELSLTCAPSHRGKGLMRRLVTLGCNEIGGAIIAEVKRVNAPMNAIVTASGFALTGQRDDLGIWRRPSFSELLDEYNRCAKAYWWLDSACGNGAPPEGREQALKDRQEAYNGLMKVANLMQVVNPVEHQRRWGT